MAHSIAASHAVTGGFVFPIRCRFGSRHRLGVEPTVGPQCDPRRTQPRAFVFLAVVFLFMSNCHVSWIGSRNPCAQAHDGGLRGGPAGDCEMPLRYGSRCRANNLREGAMVPLHGTCLLEVRALIGRQDSGGLILSHWPSTPVTSQYSPLRLFTPRAKTILPAR